MPLKFKVVLWALKAGCSKIQFWIHFPGGGYTFSGRENTKTWICCHQMDSCFPVVNFMPSLGRESILKFTFRRGSTVSILTSPQGHSGTRRMPGCPYPLSHSLFTTIVIGHEAKFFPSHYTMCSVPWVAMFCKAFLTYSTGYWAGTTATVQPNW